MLSKHSTNTDSEITSLLLRHGIQPTAQRTLIARTLFGHGTHLAAEDLFRLVNADGGRVSKATIYNTLGLFAGKGIIRAVVADPDRVFYDPNTSPHHHFYNEVSGELVDIDASEVRVVGLPPMPEDCELEGVDVIIRLRPRLPTNN